MLLHHRNKTIIRVAECPVVTDMFPSWLRTNISYFTSKIVARILTLRYLEWLFNLSDDFHEHLQRGNPLIDLGSILLFLSNMSASAVVQNFPDMPGSFAPDELVGCWQDPFQDSCKQTEDTKEEAIAPDKVATSDFSSDSTQHATKEQGTPLGDVEWMAHDSPRILRKAPTTTSQIILDIIESSIDNVRSRCRQEILRTQEEEQGRAAEEEAARSRERHGDQPYLPIILVSEVPEQSKPPKAEESPTRSHAPDPASAPPTETPPPPPPPPPLPPPPPPPKSIASIWTILKSEKRHRPVIRRLFRRNDGDRHAESSAVGSAREALRSKLEARLVGTLDVDNADLKTRQTMEALRKIGVFKGPDPDEPV